MIGTWIVTFQFVELLLIKQIALHLGSIRESVLQRH
jgi:hypothetical protein